jgi:hypothetical protein
VGIPGDVNGNGIVDIFDSVILAGAYNSKPGDPNWNPNADLNGDGVVDIIDIALIASHFGQHSPWPTFASLFSETSRLKGPVVLTLARCLVPILV